MIYERSHAPKIKHPPRHHGFIGDFHTLGTIEWAFNRGNGINGVMLGYSGAELGQSLVDIDEKKVG